MALEIQIVIGLTLLLLLIASFIIVFVFLHQQQYHRYLREKEEMKNTYKQELLKAQLEIKEQTLQLISQEIHDNIGQILSLVKLHLNTVPSQADSALAGKITTSKELLSKAIQDLRDLAKTLNSAQASDRSLSSSLERELNLINKSGLYTTHLTVEGNEELFDPQKQLIIFRIAQEILNNILKHAKAKTIRVNLVYQPTSFLMHIEDDGIGFDMRSIQQKNKAETGIGIQNMYTRAKLIGADFSIDSKAGSGFHTRLLLPLN